jgi:hypothetical protein
MDVALSQFFCMAYKLARAANLPLPLAQDLLHLVMPSRMKFVHLFVPREFSEHF